eukprot:CAMPEP_0117574334 /NCGR_PEP_ID=MMETSP0784-20121206/61513_1 /TAXON_ID=39447 /ORGANISM="" /LENGTH=31 /DNA_ID= /DNA_START= /DNA_END= /DNA_ORIENTATION=
MRLLSTRGAQYDWRTCLEACVPLVGPSSRMP